MTSSAGGTYLHAGTLLWERRAFMPKSRMPQPEYTMNIFYIIGVIVVVVFVAGFFGLHAWTGYLTETTGSGIRVANFESAHGKRKRCADRIGKNDLSIVYRNAVERYWPANP
jgi:hypothetical protein